MLKLLLLAVLPVMLCGCPTWQDKANQTLKGVFETTKTADGIANAYLHDKCMKAAATCKARGPAVAPMTKPASAPAAAPEAACPELVACQKTKHAFEDIVLSIHHAIAAGLVAIQLGDEGLTGDWVSKVLAAVSHLQELAKTAGIWERK